MQLYKSKFILSLRNTFILLYFVLLFYLNVCSYFLSLPVAVSSLKCMKTNENMKTPNIIENALV